MKNSKATSILALYMIFALVACKKDDPSTPAPAPPANEEELITTVMLTFTDTENSANVYEMSFTDLDGGGGDDPVISTVPLPSGRAFSLSVRFLNEAASPAEDITAEVASEGSEHQVFFQLEGAPLSINYGDMDADGFPIGLMNTAITGSPGTGGLTVTLRHEPVKDAIGVSDGDITNAGGETDVQTTPPFAIVVE